MRLSLKNFLGENETDDIVAVFKVINGKYMCATIEKYIHSDS